MVMRTINATWRRRICMVAGLAVLGGALPALAAGYPERPIRMIVPFSAGGGTDTVARVIAEHMHKALGQPVVVDNRPGAGSAIGSEMAARATPDGYTVIMVSGSYGANGALRKLPYDPVDGIQPIVLIGETGLLGVVHPSVPVKSIKDLIAHARANPGKLNYASVGTGSLNHLATELFKLETKTQLTHVPYKGSGPSLTAIVAGEVQVNFGSVVPSIPHVKAGRLRAIGVTTDKRLNVLPDVPTVSETVPGYEVFHWYGLWAPKGISKDITMRWNREIAKLLATSEMKARMAREGLEPKGGPPEQFRKALRRDVAKWKRVVKDAGVTLGG